MLNRLMHMLNRLMHMLNRPMHMLNRHMLSRLMFSVRVGEHSTVCMEAWFAAKTRL